VQRMWKVILGRLRILLFSRKGCLFDYDVRMRNSGTITGKKGSAIGGFRNQTTALFGNPETVVLNSGSIRLEENARIHKGAKITNSGSVLIGSGTYINPNSLMVIHHLLEIGKDCAISWNVTFMDHDLHRIGAADQERKAKGIRIGHKVWIGSDVKILKDVEIGSGSVIAANSVVVSSIPENCLAGGIPARVLKTDINWN